MCIEKKKKIMIDISSLILEILYTYIHTYIHTFIYSHFDFNSRQTYLTCFLSPSFPLASPGITFSKFWELVYHL